MTAESRIKIDYELEVWARTVLIGTRPPSPADKVKAYRILAQIQPQAYQTRLAQALAELAWRSESTRLSLFEEAVTVLRAAPEDANGRAELVVRTMNSYHRTLYDHGKRADGLAICEEMAAASRTAIKDGERGWVEWGLRSYAHRLAEEGRHHEAAELLKELVSVKDLGDSNLPSVWDRLSLIAALDASGHPSKAAKSMKGLLDDKRNLLRDDKTSRGGVFHSLVWYSKLLDRAGQSQAAKSSRSEAHELLQLLASAGEPKNWSGAQFTFAGILLAVQAQDTEPIVPGQPRPAFGVDMMNWSLDLRNRYIDETGTIQCGCRPLAPTRHETLADRAETESDLPALASLRRRLAIRTAAYWLWHRGHLFLEQALPTLGASVETSREQHSQDKVLGGQALSKALTDRAMALVAGHRYTAALSDYAEALHLSE